jgi:iron complex outermembrane recepter protein
VVSKEPEGLLLLPIATVLRGFLPILAAFLWIFAMLQASAQGPVLPPTSANLKALSLEQLGNIEVTTESKEPTEVWNTPSAIYVLTQEDIRRSGVSNVADALRLVPSVNVARVNGSRNWAGAIRGLGDQFSRYVLVLIDGRSVYTPLFGGVFWTINNVMIRDVDRIEVIRGSGGGNLGHGCSQRNYQHHYQILQ